MLMDWLIAWVNANAQAIAFGAGVTGVGVIAWVFHRSVVDLAVRSEREACAETAEALLVPDRGDWSRGARCMRDRVAAAIRGRGGHPWPELARRGDQQRFKALSRRS